MGLSDIIYVTMHECSGSPPDVEHLSSKVVTRLLQPQNFHTYMYVYGIATFDYTIASYAVAMHNSSNASHMNC